jgi:hypothetical protein
MERVVCGTAQQKKHSKLKRDPAQKVSIDLTYGNLRRLLSQHFYGEK